MTDVTDVTGVTDTRSTDVEPGTASLPPDPDLYDSPRATRARAKGLDAPYIRGGDDPDPARGIADER
ncbi:MAG: hypothetical protein ABIQ58_03560, partial [Candidatus Limnocylindrales bacterium]